MAQAVRLGWATFRSVLVHPNYIGGKKKTVRESETNALESRGFETGKEGRIAG